MVGSRRLFLVAALLALAPVSPSSAGDLVGLGSELPRVQFDVPRTVVARESTGPIGRRLVTIELPVSMVVARGEVDRVEEVVISIDGAAAGLTVSDYAPATTLTTEFAGDIEVRTSSESDKHLSGSLGGILPNPGGAVAQLTPSISAGTAGRETETETVKRLAPKEAIVVAGAFNRRQGVLYKFRPSSQTTLEGERRLSITFMAPEAWQGGELTVRCIARGEQRVLFVKQQKTWGSAEEPVEVRLASQPAERQTVAKPVAAESADKESGDRESADRAPVQQASMWKARKVVTP